MSSSGGGARRIPPYEVLLVAAGLTAGAIPWLPHLRLSPELVLGVFVPPLVFQAASTLNQKALLRVASEVALLTVLGVAVSATLMALTARYLLALSWPESILLGAILSPTDPIAVVALIRRSRSPQGLVSLLEGESLANDGISVALWQAALVAVAGGSFGAPGLGVAFARLVLIGIVAGAAGAMAAALWLKLASFTGHRLLVTVVVAYGVFALASDLGGSGVVADVAAGLLLVRLAPFGRGVEAGWSKLTTWLSLPLFLLIGLGLPTLSVVGQVEAALLALGTVWVARLLAVQLLLPRWRARQRLLVWWGGIRGALPVAMALASTAYPGVDPRVPEIAYGVVALSLVIQGVTLAPVTSLLKLRNGA